MPKTSKSRVRKSRVRKSRVRKSRVRKYKMNKKIGDAPVRVLILCQIKTGKISKDDSENVSKQINPAIEELASDIIQSPKESCTFEYMSPGVMYLDGTADYLFRLDLENEDAKTFFGNNQKKYKAVVFQTCPIMYMKHTISLVASLLEDNGLLMIVAVNKVSHNTVSINKIDLLEKGPPFQEFVTELYKYFEPTIQPFIYRKR
jgi:hypothetical protein